MSANRPPIALALLICVPAATLVAAERDGADQPAAEGTGRRFTPQLFPKEDEHVATSQDPHWDLFLTTRLTQAPPDYLYRAAFSAAVAALDGSQMSLTGYAVPYEQGAESDHILLSRYSPDCPYCPQGRPNELVEVFLDKPIHVQGKRAIRLSGRFQLQDNRQAGLFFRLDGTALP